MGYGGGMSTAHGDDGTRPGSDGGAAHRIEGLVSVARDAASRGLVLASAGNLSVRIDERSYAVSRSGVWFDRMTVEDFAILPLPAAADDIDAVSPRPSSEWRLHERAYLTRPDIQCVLHLHPLRSVTLASLGIPIRLIAQDHALYVGSIGIAAFHPNGSQELADTAAAELREHDAVIMRHHGCVVVADSVEMAYRRALNLEDAAKATALAISVGDRDTAFPADALDNLHHA